MSQYNHEITIHLLRHSSMMQVVSTINVGSKGMRISSLKGISSIEQALEYAKPLCDVA